MEDKRWFGFMATDEWVVFMNIMRILSLIAIVILIFIMVRNIEEVKTIANPCKMCTEKTGAVCMIRENEVSLGEIDISNLQIKNKT